MSGTPGAKSPVATAYKLTAEVKKNLLMLVCDLQHLQSLRHRLRFRVKFWAYTSRT